MEFEKKPSNYQRRIRGRGAVWGETRGTVGHWGGGKHFVTLSSCCLHRRETASAFLTTWQLLSSEVIYSLGCSIGFISPSLLSQAASKLTIYS